MYMYIYKALKGGSIGIILCLRKSKCFLYNAVSAKQVNYWFHFYNIFGMTRSVICDWTRDLQHSKSEDSTKRLSRHKWRHI